MELKIAWRYLFAKKSHNAINIVSGVSAAGIGVTTAALVCVLSVLNGFNTVLEGMFSQFDPELRITPAHGKIVRLDAAEMRAAAACPAVEYFSPVVEERAMVSYKDHQTPATVKGVDEHYRLITGIDSIITDGYYEVYDGAFDRCVMGRGLAAQIGINAHFVGPVRLYAPDRNAHISLMRPDKALNKETTYIAGTFATGQVQLDDGLMLVSADCARRLFNFSDEEASAVEIKVASGTGAAAGKSQVQKAKKQLRAILGDGYAVCDRYEQQADFFRIARVEKLISILLLTFILIIASFNSVSSLFMLMLEKQADMQILSSMGAQDSQIRRIFLYEGWLISVLGAVFGLAAGLLICLMQQHFGFLKLGNGSDYIISAYPVTVIPSDIVLIALIVLAIGWFTAWLPTHGLRRRGPVAGTTILACIAALLCMTSCHKPHPNPDDPTAKYDSVFTTAYISQYGPLYAEGGLTSHVADLDIYSEGLKLNKQGRIAGTGTNLYFSDIFFTPDTVTGRPLPAGTYSADTTGAPFTFLPGASYQGNITGTYLLSVSDAELQSFRLLSGGQLQVSYSGDTLLLLFAEPETAKTHYRAVCSAVPKVTEVTERQLRHLLP